MTSPHGTPAPRVDRNDEINSFANDFTHRLLTDFRSELLEGAKGRNCAVGMNGGRATRMSRIRGLQKCARRPVADVANVDAARSQPHRALERRPWQQSHVCGARPVDSGLDFRGVLKNDQTDFGAAATISAITALANVVLPDPAPPLITMFRREADGVSDGGRLPLGNDPCPRIVVEREEPRRARRIVKVGAATIGEVDLRTGAR